MTHESSSTRARGRFALVLGLAVFAGAGCAGEGEGPTSKAAALRLDRGPSGEVVLQVDHAPPGVWTIDAELSISGGRAFEISGATSAPGVGLDTVRVKMAGANRAILFAGDKRGPRIPERGPVAQFSVRSLSALAAQDSWLSISRANVVDADGARLDVSLGPALAVR